MDFEEYPSSKFFFDQNEMSFSFKCLLNVILEICDEKEK